jgi:hypothetical protein
MRRKINYKQTICMTSVLVCRRHSGRRLRVSKVLLSTMEVRTDTKDMQLSNRAHSSLFLNITYIGTQGCTDGSEDETFDTKIDSTIGNQHRQQQRQCQKQWQEKRIVYTCACQLAIKILLVIISPYAHNTRKIIQSFNTKMITLSYILCALEYEEITFHNCHPVFYWRDNDA